MFREERMFHGKDGGGMLKGKVPEYGGGKCSGCGEENDREGQRYCGDCHAAEQKRYRARLRAKLERLKVLESVQAQSDDVAHLEAISGQSGEESQEISEEEKTPEG